MIKDIAQGEGDLTKRLQVKTHDEIGELSDRLNQFIEKLQALMSEVTRNAVTINKASTEFTDLSASMSTGVNGLSERAGAAAGGADNMTSMSGAIKEQIQGIQSSTTGTVEVIGNISEVVTEINTIVATIANGCGIAL
nr:methyl-accepting chemotaxis protein [uncultured Desulfobacter sp.]